MSWLPIEPIADINTNELIEFSIEEICLAFKVPSILIDGKQCNKEVTEDAEFEIIEPKQLPMPIDLSDANEKIKNINDVVGRNLQCIAEHTVDLSLINRDSKVLDLGCRAFTWSKAMLEYVDKIVCVDADPIIIQPEDERIIFLDGAIVPNGEPVHFVNFVVHGNGTGNYIDDGRPLPKPGMGYRVASITIEEIQKETGWLDLIKMDIEGSEVPVLLSLTKPPAKQITCEFHMHTGTPRYTVESVFDHMHDLSYDIKHVDFSRKHGLGENFWDVLFVLKDAAT